MEKMKTELIIVILFAFLLVWWCGYHEGKGDIKWINDLIDQH